MARNTPRKELTLTIPMRVVGIDANWESTFTTPACAFRNEVVYPDFVRKGFTVNEFQGCMARRLYTSVTVPQPGVVYITGSGHGTADTFAGFQNEPIFRVGYYHPDEVKDKIIHLLSCNSAIELGKDLVRNHCRAFFGYDEDFPYIPTVQDMFFECDAEIDRAFTDGATAAKVHERVMKLVADKAAELRSGGNFRHAAVLETTFCHSALPLVRGP